METKVDNEPETGVSSLVSGIVQDLRQLLAQQLALFQVEVKNDVRRTINACIPMIVGGVICFLALFMMLHAAACFISWIAEIPYWAGYVIIGSGTGILGGLLVIWGAMQFRNFNPLPEKSFEALKENLHLQENLHWKTKR